MRVTRVNTDKFYKKKYVLINNSILDIETALETYPKKEKTLIKTALDYKPAKELIQSNYLVFPSNNKMIEDLIKLRQDIYEELNINKIVGEDADIVKAIVLFDYLCINSFYDMTSMEEVEVIENVTDNLGKKLDYSLEEYITTKKKLKQATSTEERLMLRKELIKIAKDQAELNVQFVKQEIKQQNRSYLKKLYNVLKRHKGVCDEFSYVYQFLLNGQKINSYHVSMYAKGMTYGHAVNLVEYKKDGQRGYFFVDVTEGTATVMKHPNWFTHSKSFAIPKDDFLGLGNGYKITQLDYVDSISSNTEKDFCKIIDMKEHIKLVENKILDKNIFKEQIKKAGHFIASKYKVYEQEKEKTV